MRDKAISDRGPRSIGLVWEHMNRMVDGKIVTLQIMKKQMMADFALSEEELGKTQLSRVELMMSGVC